MIATAPEDLAFVRSVALGGAWALDGLWRRLGIDQVIERLLGERRLDRRAERLVFALVANRALAPQSKLSCCEWLAGDVAIPGLQPGAVGEDPQPLYRAMDWLLEIEARLAEQVYWATADLLNLEVDLLFFDTTSTYFERDERDGAAVDEDGVAHPPFRVYGHSKDHRDDLPQVVVGLAVTRTGIPIRAWCWPGNTGDQPLIGQVKDELREWRLSRVVWVTDRGFQSAENRRYLQRAGGHYIIGEKLRGDSKEANAALAREGRYHTVAGNLQVKEVRVDDATMRDRFVICRNPEQAERDERVRDELVKQLEQAIDGSDRLGAEERARLAGRLQAKRALTRYLRQTKTGLL
ncbi:MAG: IS1634 family transposase, partial [Actinobacteria bacterium]|nr:IS1634 family transposase [Actinomycetota bacterium]